MTDFNYNHPAYLARHLSQAARTTVTSSAGVNAHSYWPIAATLHKTHIRVATAGVANSSLNLIKVSGTTTTTVGSYANGTAAAGSTTTITPSAANGAIAAGDILYLANGTSTDNGIFDVAHEYSFRFPAASFT